MGRREQFSVGELTMVGVVKDGVRVLTRDADGKILLASGTSVPSAVAGYAKGCIFIKTDAGNGVKALYENKGTTASCSFDVIGDIAAAEITLASAKMLVGNAGGLAAAVDLGGDVTVDNAGVVTIGAKKVGAPKIALSNGKILVGTVGGAAEEQALGADATLLAAKVTLSNAQIKTLATTAIEIVAAPGANKVVEFVSALLRLNNGSEVLTEVDDNIAFKYVDKNGIQCSQTVECTGFIDQLAVTYTNAKGKIDVIATVAQCVNVPIVLHNINDNFAGNASNDATLDVWVHYRVITIA